MARHRIVSTLTAPGSVALDHGDTLTLGWKVDAGWNWAASIESASYDITHARDSVYSASITDGYGNTLTNARLIAGPRDQTKATEIDNPGITNLSGYDVTTLRMAKKNQSFPSFRATTSTALLAELATRADVSITGLDDWYIGEDEVKGESVASAVARLCEAAAFDYVIGVDGAITCTAWQAVGGTLSFAHETLTRNYDPFKIYTGRRYGKRSSIPAGNEQTYNFSAADSYAQALSAPMLGPGAYEAGGLGAIAAVAFFDASDDLLAFYSFDTDYVNTDPATGSGPATSMTVVCKDIGMPYPVNAILKVTGTPYGEEGLPSGVDLSFLYPPLSGDPDTSLGAWPNESDSIDPVYPGQGWVEDRYAYLLAKLNWPGDFLMMSGLLDVSVEPLERYTFASNPYKVMEIAHSVGQNNTTLMLGRV